MIIRGPIPTMVESLINKERRMWNLEEIVHILSACDPILTTPLHNINESDRLVDHSCGPERKGHQLSFSQQNMENLPHYRRDSTIGISFFMSNLDLDNKVLQSSISFSSCTCQLEGETLPMCFKTPSLLGYASVIFSS
ncbi:hypothetical protein ACFX2B_012556 [Malus domestica]